MCREFGEAGRPGGGAAISAATPRGGGSGQCPGGRGRAALALLPEALWLPDEPLGLTAHTFVGCLLSDSFPALAGSGRVLGESEGLSGPGRCGGRTGSGCAGLVRYAE